jgi:Tat protein secretion system quality control protein TatD with DNase activity
MFVFNYNKNVLRALCKISIAQAVTPLILAARSGHETMVEYLLSSGADANHASQVESRVLLLCRKDCDDLLNRLQQGATALYNACYNGHLSTAEKLLRSGADINFQSGSGTYLVNCWYFLVCLPCI